MKIFSADFETSTEEWSKSDAWVWAWACCEIGCIKNMTYGNSIGEFMTFVRQNENSIFYFHNAKFDFQFIISYLLNNGYTHVKEKSEIVDHTFTTLITEMGQYYSMTIYFKGKKRKLSHVEFRDSLKLLNFSVKVIAKSFGLPINKLELDYDTIREKGHVLTEHEKNYISHDVMIVALALEQLFQKGYTRLTIGSNALNDYKERVRHFEKYFPDISEFHKDLKQSYKGGFVYVNPVWKGRETPAGVVLDVNSLYPHCLRNFPMPIGYPIQFLGEYVEDKLYPLYILQFSCMFQVKEGYLPTIQIKNNMYYASNEYLESSNGEKIVLTLTSVDLKLFFDHYHVYDFKAIQGWKFKSQKGLFNSYVDYWTEEKIKAGREGNKGLRTIAKLFQNSLYGKFATKEEGALKTPVLDEEGVLHYPTGEKEPRPTVYIPVASFVTSYARNITIRTSQTIREESIKRYGKDLYFYSDTDSCHCGITDIDFLKSIVDIDDFALGCWKLETTFLRGKFLRQKSYVEEVETVNEKGLCEKGLNVTCAGMPKTCYKDVTFENFQVGFTSHEKLVPKNVRGGVLLHKTTFEIKE